MTVGTNVGLETPPDSRLDLLPGEKDELYHWENVSFLVDGFVFKVPGYHFIVGSEYFTTKYLHVAGQAQDVDEWSTVSGEGESAPPLRNQGTAKGVVALKDVTASQFRTFLKLLFPIHSTSTTLALTKPEWLTILTLSTRWHFLEFRGLAIQHLHPQMTDPVEMIQVGRAEYVPRWVMAGYAALVNKPEAISEEESEAIGDRTAVRLYIIRHELGCQHPEIGQAGRNVSDGLLTLKFEEEFLTLKERETERRTRLEKAEAEMVEHMKREEAGIMERIKREETERRTCLEKAEAEMVERMKREEMEMVERIKREEMEMLERIKREEIERRTRLEKAEAEMVDRKKWEEAEVVERIKREEEQRVVEEENERKRLEEEGRQRLEAEERRRFQEEDKLIKEVEERVKQEDMRRKQQEAKRIKKAAKKRNRGAVIPDAGGFEPGEDLAGVEEEDNLEEAEAETLAARLEGSEEASQAGELTDERKRLAEEEERKTQIEEKEKLRRVENQVAKPKAEEEVGHTQFEATSKNGTIALTQHLSQSTSVVKPLGAAPVSVRQLAATQKPASSNKSNSRAERPDSFALALGDIWKEWSR